MQGVNEHPPRDAGDRVAAVPVVGGVGMLLGGAGSKSGICGLRERMATSLRGGDAGRGPGRPVYESLGSEDITSEGVEDRVGRCPSCLQVRIHFWCQYGIG